MMMKPKLPLVIEEKLLEMLALEGLSEGNCFQYQKRLAIIRREMYNLSEGFIKAEASEETYRDGYLAYHFPINFIKGFLIGQRLKKADHDVKSKLNILDVGCGEGAGMFGLCWGIKEICPDTQFFLTGIDTSGIMLEKCQIIGNGLKPHCRKFNFKCLKQKIGYRFSKIEKEKYDFVILANSLAEILRDENIPIKFIKRVAETLRNNGLLIIIEPALKKFTRRLMLLREAIIKENIWSIVLPCPHQEPCSLLPISRRNEWCHEAIRWHPPEFMKILNQGLNREIYCLKFSYLIISRKNLKKEEGRFYVLSHLLREKGKTKCFLCTPHGRVELVRLNKHQSEKNVRFDKIVKGDIIRLENYIQHRPNYWQIKENTKIAT